MLVFLSLLGLLCLFMGLLIAVIMWADGEVELSGWPLFVACIGACLWILVAWLDGKDTCERENVLKKNQYCVKVWIPNYEKEKKL